MKSASVLFRPAHLNDIESLVAIEQQAFTGDRLSRRRLRHWILANNAVLLVAEKDNQVLAYALVLLHKGTRLSRLYSIAVSADARGMGLGRQLMQAVEKEVAELGWIFMRLEVAKNNHAAITLYQSMGYSIFGVYNDYYEDHQDALRMQKRIRYVEKNLIQREVPWYQQTTDFTCGPAALMMAMASLDNKQALTQTVELDIWREATTIFMTTGCAGCHPLGLALAAKRRGFTVQAWLNQTSTLFLEGVRSADKKSVLHVVDEHFRAQVKKEKLKLHQAEISQQQIEKSLNAGAAVIILISTYRMDGKKAPHWVVVSAMDEHCLYVHEPDPTPGEQTPVDCQYMPIARRDFDKMSIFGKDKLRTALVISR